MVTKPFIFEYERRLCLFGQRGTTHQLPAPVYLLNKKGSTPHRTAPIRNACHNKTLGDAIIVQVSLRESNLTRLECYRPNRGIFVLKVLRELFQGEALFPGYSHCVKYHLRSVWVYLVLTAEYFGGTSKHRMTIPSVEKSMCLCLLIRYLAEITYPPFNAPIALEFITFFGPLTVRSAP